MLREGERVSAGTDNAVDLEDDQRAVIRRADYHRPPAVAIAPHHHHGAFGMPRSHDQHITRASA
jgi:hypothetical protein